MITNLKANFITVTLLLFCTSSFGKLPNHYLGIAEKYNIHPFEMEYGYPLSYNTKELPSCIIYLSNEIEYMEKLDAVTYVCKPTVANAKEIGLFIPEERLFNNYYLVVDSNVVKSEMEDFIEELIIPGFSIPIRLIEGRGRYLEIKYCSPIPFNGCPKAPSISSHLVFEILLNSRNELLVESERIGLTDLYNKVFEYLYNNISKNDLDLSSLNYWELDSHVFRKNIEDIKCRYPKNWDSKFR